MQSSHATPRKARPVLALLTLAVSLAHAALLHGATLSLAIGSTDYATGSHVFATRTITPEAVAAVPASPTPEVTGPVVKRLPAQASPDRVARTLSAEKFDEMRPAPDAHETLPTLESTAALAPPDAAPVQLAAAMQASAGREATSDLTSPASGSTARHFAIPASARLKYALKGEVKGFPYRVNGELLWQHDDTSYTARLEISHFLLGSRVQTSKGELGVQGLVPIRFGDKVRSEVAAHFERAKGKVTFSANTPDATLTPGAQDQLSVFIQLASMVGGEPEQFVPGTKVAFQAVGPRTSEQWVFVAGAIEALELPGGTVRALKFSREPSADFDSRADIWLAPNLGYLPVRILLTQANGDFADQLWRATESP